MENKWIDEWVKIGNRNPWISAAVDPPFDKRMLYKCDTLEKLWEKISYGNWCLGQGFYYGDICLINQIDGGDEWMVIKQNVDFESFTVGAMGKEGFFENIRGIQKSTLDQCRRLEYRNH